MTWKQLLAVLTVVVAMFSTAITISTLYTISGFERLESRIDRLEGKMESQMDRLESKLESKIDQLESKLESKIDQLDNKVDGLSNEVAEIKGGLKAKGIMANR